MSGNAAQQVDVLVIGSGIAGLSAAVSAAEELAGSAGRVLLIDRAGPRQAGGNTRWTSAYFRLDDVYDPGPHFVRDMLAFSDNRTPEAYVRRMVELIPDTMDWVQGHGVRFHRSPTYFINSLRPRLQPLGGGEALVTTLSRSASDLGVEMRYETTAGELMTNAEGTVTGAEVVDARGSREAIEARAVVIASGGFEANSVMLDDALGAPSDTLRLIAPGSAFNRGEGIVMAQRAGAAVSGQWNGFHAEPIDPRSSDPEALVMVFPYGILVNSDGARFIDEGRGTVDETYESVARSVWRQPGGTAHFITDQRFRSIESWDRGLLTSVKPIVADDLAGLADQIGVPREALGATVEAYNAATGDGTFDWRVPDGRRTNGVEPPKSNWAMPLNEPPYISYPVVCAVVFTFGGIATDPDGRVLRHDGQALPGLFAAGECTGIYFGKYPGGTSVMRGMIFGRTAGKNAAHNPGSSRREGVTMGDS